ncbi:zinc-ribbon domain containing protein [Patescibacteria group bacterium]|nr:zinc-ribbon domain containing protein [Patescibacteria group bacterium]MBU1673705.1 zinc-ribbon domain containing protein [Patescibacteria group bacterium]MBU1963065.1 zinc-ribbon domain containing protein [Patescibacteria group bacterium]
MKCTNCGQQFTIYPEDKEFYQRIEVPEPTHCPDCRFQRRLSWRNEKTLYQAKCRLCKKDMISTLPDDSLYTVYCQDCWWSDKWDPASYGRDYDFNKPFFENFDALQKEVPIFNLTNIRETNENCDYVNFVSHAKDCYLVFAANWLENIMYSDYIWHSKDCMDCSYLRECELCYGCLDCDNLFNCQYLQQSKDCTDCIFGYGLKNCKNCFGCANLINEEYHFFNKKLSPDKYKEKVEKIMSDQAGFEKQKNKFFEFSMKFPRKFAHQINCENSTGDGIKNCSHCQDIFDGEKGENSKWLINFPASTKECYDISGCGEIELSYEGSCAGLPVHNLKFGHVVFNSENIMYSTFIDGSKNLFGCSGIRKGEHYILNKKYSQDEYEKLKEKIINKMKEEGEFGEFFPASISPYFYNDTSAQELFPLKKEEALEKNYKWQDEDKKSVDPKLLVCSDCGQNFQIIPQEKKYYKENNIFTPTKCYKCRHKERMSRRNPRKLWDRQCDKCGAKIKTTYAPEKPEIVYCEDCYKKEIY